MAEFAPVCPTAVARGLKEFKALGSYHLLLAHDIVARPTDYIDIYGDITDPHIILDNSVIELGRPVESEILLEAIEVVHPAVVVLPDHIKDYYRTIRDGIDVGAQWISKGIEIPFMVVPHASELHLAIHCIRTLIWKLEGRVKAVGVPRVFVEQFGTRYNALLNIHKEFPDLTIHMLGFSDSLLDDIRCARLPFVKGIDSAVPLRLGHEGREIDLLQSSHSPRGDFWDVKTTTPLMVGNVQKVRQWLR